MTIQIGTHTATAEPEDLTAARLALIEAIRRGEGGVELLRKLIGHSRLTPEQQSLVDALLEAGSTADDDDETLTGQGVEEREALRSELNDLREVNDTLAAALGACRYCWGGVRTCATCRGRGQVGYAAPDPALFNELIVPAVRHARAIRNAGTRSRSGRRHG